MNIDLRSDTVTKPSIAMLNAMLTAPLGDDVFAEDPTVNLLEEKTAKLFAKEAALFCPTGTMANQIAVKAHTQPLDEIILHKDAHIYKYETGGWAFHSGVSVKLLDGERGKLNAENIKANIQEDFDWLPNTSMVAIENTVNRGGGSIYSYQRMKAIAAVCKNEKLKLHLDGARIFNAIVESDYTTKNVGELVDSISICLSKGLACPAGTVLAGNKTFIKKARKIRKAMGGGMRQAGILAAAGIFALENNVERLTEDHQKAKKLGEFLNNLNYIEKVLEPETNILIFKIKEDLPGKEFVKKLEEKNIKAIEFGPQWVRFVLHIDITDQMVESVEKALKSIQ